MRINKTLIERGKLGRDKVIINLDNLILPEEEFPVYLENANVDKENIGTARIYRDPKTHWLLADIDLPSNKIYLKLYPTVAISITSPDDCHYTGNIRTVNYAIMIGIVLSQNPNNDSRIVPLGKRILN